MEGVSHLYNEINNITCISAHQIKACHAGKEEYVQKKVTVTFYKTYIYIAKIEQCLTVNIQSCGFALSSTRADLPKVFFF